jgi:hypothetical protein
MNGIPNDTHPDVERLQIELLRQLSVAKRLAIMHSLSQTAVFLSRRAIQRANPGLSQTELGILFVRYHYGDELADKVQHYLEQRKNESS